MKRLFKALLIIVAVLIVLVGLLRGMFIFSYPMWVRSLN